MVFSHTSGPYTALDNLSPLNTKYLDTSIIAKLKIPIIPSKIISPPVNLTSESISLTGGTNKATAKNKRLISKEKIRY